MNKSTANPAPAQPRCLTCRDTGKVMGRDIAAFKPRNTWLVCPDCPPREPFILGRCANWIAFVLWGVR